MLSLVLLTFCGLIACSIGLGPLDGNLDNFKLVWGNVSNYDDYVEFGYKPIGQLVDDSGYHRRTGYRTFYSTALKSDFKRNGSIEYIMETKLDGNTSFHLFIENGTMSWAYGNENYTIRYDCVGLDTKDIKSKWILLLLKFDMYRFIDYYGNNDCVSNDSSQCHDIYVPIRMKKLDIRTPLSESPREIRCVKANNPSISFDQKDLSIRLGRGFTGSMAYGSVFLTGGSDSYIDNVLKYKLPDEYEDNVFRRFFLHWDSHLIPYRNSNIRKDIENEISTKYYTNVTCKKASMSIHIKPGPFNITLPKQRSYYGRDYQSSYNYNRYYNYWDYSMNITLGTAHRNCRFTWDKYNDRFEINGDLKGCGFKQSNDPHTGDKTFKSKVYANTYTETTPLMDVSCKYERAPTIYNDVNIEAFAVDGSMIQLDGVAEQPHLNFTLRLYSNSKFSFRLKNPLKVAERDVLFVEASVEAMNRTSSYNSTIKYKHGFELKIQSCLTKVVLNTVSSVTHKLIEDGGIVENSVKFLPSSSTSKKRFRFRAMKFEQFPDAIIYLNCVMSASDTR